VGKRDGKEKERKGKETGAVYAVTAKVVDVPLEVLPGRQKEFSNFVSKVRLCFLSSFLPSFSFLPSLFSQFSLFLFLSLFSDTQANSRSRNRSYGTQKAP
jgi:hypothetical protein